MGTQELMELALKLGLVERIDLVDQVPHGLAKTDPEIDQIWIAEAEPGQATSVQITSPEAEMLYWVVHGKTNRDIGDILGISTAPLTSISS